LSGENALYKEALLDHFKNPRNHRREPFDGQYVTARGRNPRCGDDVEVGFKVEQGHIVDAGFRGRGCSICMASTSMLVEALTKSELVEAKALYAQVKSWADEESLLPDNLRPLDAVRSSPSRKRCALLGWNALGELLQSTT